MAGAARQPQGEPRTRRVRMRHDGVEGTITVAGSAVPAHLAAGWEEIPVPPAAPAGGAREDSTASRRRAAKTDMTGE